MHHRALTWYRSLAEATGRRREGFFLVEGWRAVSQILQTSPHDVSELIAVTEAAVPQVSCPIRRLSSSQFNRIAPSKSPQGLMAVVRMPDGVQSGELPLAVEGDVLVCERVQDPGNVGTLIRSAAAFGFAGVVLSDDSADPFGPKAVQASAGTLLSLWIRRSAAYVEMIEKLRLRGWRVVAADIRGEAKEPHVGNYPVVVVVGSEASGVSSRVLAIADMAFSIPIASDRAESLNVAAAGAIAMYLVARCRGREQRHRSSL